MGLTRGYTREPVSTTAVKAKLSELQHYLYNEKSIRLSANCWESEIVFFEQYEPHINIKFINYPKFPHDEATFKEAVLFIAKKLMDTFEQNRLVIEFHDGFTMLEKTGDIDPGVR